MSLLEYFLIYGSIFSPVIPFLITLLPGKKLEKPGRVILIFILLSFASDVISGFIISGNNYPFYHFYGWVETIVILFFYYYSIDLRRRYFVATIVIFTILYGLNSLVNESIYDFNAFGRSIECLLIIGASLILFYQFYEREDDIFIERSGLFWINIGILVYFSGAFFSFLLGKEILSGPLPWMLHNSSNIMKNFLLAVGIWRMKVN